MIKRRRPSKADMQLVAITGLFVLMCGAAFGGALVFLLNKGLGTAVFLIAGAH